MTRPQPIELNPEILPWEQQPGENARWFSRFTCYRLSGSRRSVRSCFRKTWEADRVAKGVERCQLSPPDSVPHSWEVASRRFRWSERAAAWDMHFYQQQEQMLLLRWEEHRTILLDRCQRLIELADEMLKQPLLTEKIVRDTYIAQSSGEEIETQVTLVKPATWRFRDVPIFYEKATELLRIICGDEEWMIRQLMRRGYIVARTEEEADAIANS